MTPGESFDTNIQSQDSHCDLKFPTWKMFVSAYCAAPTLAPVYPPSGACLSRQPGSHEKNAGTGKQEWGDKGGCLSILPAVNAFAFPNEQGAAAPSVHRIHTQGL